MSPAPDISSRLFDDHGWLVGATEPWPLEESFALLSPDPSSRMDVARWAAQAAKFFRVASLAVSPGKIYEHGWPTCDAARLVLEAGTVEIITLPADRTPQIITAANAAVTKIGGAGFDALVARTQRIWQLRPVSPDDAAADLPAMLAAALLASIFLGPILAPDGAIFGVKTARERLAALGRRS